MEEAQQGTDQNQNLSSTETHQLQQILTAILEVGRAVAVETTHCEVERMGVLAQLLQ